MSPFSHFKYFLSPRLKRVFQDMRRPEQTVSQALASGVAYIISCNTALKLLV